MNWDPFAIFGRKPFEIEQNLTGKVAIVTGASSGVGKVSAYELASKGCHVFLACRNKQKTDPIISDIIQKTGNQNVEFIEFIADDLESVKKCAVEFKDRKLPLHILMNNAGCSVIGGVSTQGYQLIFAVNHLSHFLFTELLLPVLKASTPSRIVNVASILNFLGSRYDFDTLKGPSTPWIDRFFIKDYSNSKLANVMHARKLGQLLKGTGVTTYSCHPGIVATDVWRNTPRLLQPLAKRVLMIDERVGARTQLYCATAPLEGTGLYYDDCQVAKSHSLADNQEALDELYQKSMEMVQPYLL